MQSIQSSYRKISRCTSCNQGRQSKEVKSIDIFLTRIIITKDDISRYLNKIPEIDHCGKKDPIFVDIYI
jgi:hypothetical protein